MPHRPPESFRDFQVEHNQPQQGVVITKVEIMDKELPKPLQEFKPLAQQSQPVVGSRRPNTAQGIAKTPRRMSFSRPLTSDGGKLEGAPMVPKIPPKTIQTQHLSSDPGRIGVAVGSPTLYSASGTRRPRADTLPKQPKQDFARRLPRANTDTVIAPHSPRWTSEDGPSSPHKVKRWRSVGDLFRKKKSAETLQPAPTAHDPQSLRSIKQDGATKSVKLNKPSKTSKPTPRPPTIVEEDEPPQWPTRKSSMRPRFRSRSVNKSGEQKSRKPTMPRHNTAGPWSEFQTQVRKGGSRPQLDVSIPQAEFERYSIMFSELLKKPVVTEEPKSNSTGARHEPIASLDTIQSLDSTQAEKPVSNRDRPITNAVDLGLLPPPSKSAVGSHSPGTLSNASSTPKTPSYSLFPPTVKPSPNPSMGAVHQSCLARPSAASSPAVAPVAPTSTPDDEAVSVPIILRDHILSQHELPVSSTDQGLGLNTGLGMPTSGTHDKHGPAPLGGIEPRDLRSPDFSPDSPVTRGSSVSSTWSDRPSIAHSHTRSKSSAQVVGSPGPSVPSSRETFYTAEEEDAPPIPVAPHPMQNVNAIARTASLRSHPPQAPVGSPQLEYEDLISPKVAVARQVAVTGKPKKPHMLPRTSSKKREQDNKVLARLSENTERAESPKMTVVDNSDHPDEVEWLQRRSVWGVIEEGGRVAG